MRKIYKCIDFDPKNLYDRHISKRYRGQYYHDDL